MVGDTNVGSKGNSIEEDIKILENLKIAIDTGCVNFGGKSMYGCGYQEAIEHILLDYKRVLKENEDLKNEIMEKDLEIIGKEEYTKASMKEIIAQYYTSNEDCIPKSKIKDIIDRIDYDIKKTKEIIAKNTNVHATYRKNEYQIVRLRAMNTKSLDIKKRLQKLLESEEK